MSIPIQSFLSYLLDVLYESPEYQLKPIYRLNLYEMLGIPVSIRVHKKLWKQTPELFQLDSRLYRHLSFVTAQHALVIYTTWLARTVQLDSHNTTAEVFLPETLFQTGAMLLGGNSQRERVARNLLIQTEHWLYWLADDATQHVDIQKVYSAAMAIHQSVRALLGGAPFGVSINEETTDVDIPDGYGDVAHYAVRAYATVGTVQSKKNRIIPPYHMDKSKSREFWEWWLTEAIPASWEAVQREDSE
jgi:hypothetical protein